MDFQRPAPVHVECSKIDVRIHHTAHTNPLLHHMAVQMPDSGLLLDETGRACNVYYEYCHHINDRKSPVQFRAKFQRVAANFKRFF